MAFVPITKLPEAHNGEQDEEHVANFAALFPWRDLTWVSFIAKVIDTTVKPVTIAIYMELLEVFELIQRVMLQVVSHDLVLFFGLRLIFETVLGDEAARLIWNVVCRVHGRVFVLGRHGHSLLLSKETLHAALQKSVC